MTAPTNAPRNIAADLDSMLKRGSAKKAEIVKKAEEVVPALDAAEVGKTVAPTTGTQASGMKSEQEKTYTAGAVGTGAETNQPNASVTNSPQGAAAATPNGEDGAKAPAEMGTTVTKTTVNGDVMGAPEGNDTSGAFKSATARALSKMAAELEALAVKCVDPLHLFLAKSARASTNPEIKKIADGMDDQDLGQAASGNLTGQIEHGGISDEEAAAILQEAVASGAISKEELAAAVAELQNQGGAGADGGAPAADAGAADATGGSPGTTDAAAGDVPPVPASPGASDPGAAPMPADASAKMAAAHVGPDSPEYTKMIATHYAAEVEAGRKLAALIFEQGQPKVASAPVATEKAVTAPVAAEAKVASALIEAKSDDEKRALAAVQKELGIDDSQLKALSAAPSKTLDKHASLEADFRTRILNKIASLA